LQSNINPEIEAVWHFHQGGLAHDDDEDPRVPFFNELFLATKHSMNSKGLFFVDILVILSDTV